MVTYSYTTAHGALAAPAFPSTPLRETHKETETSLIIAVLNNYLASVSSVQLTMARSNMAVVEQPLVDDLLQYRCHVGGLRQSGPARPAGGEAL